MKPTQRKSEIMKTENSVRQRPGSLTTKSNILWLTACLMMACCLPVHAAKVVEIEMEQSVGTHATGDDVGSSIVTYGGATLTAILPSDTSGWPTFGPVTAAVELKEEYDLVYTCTYIDTLSELKFSFPSCYSLYNETDGVTLSSYVVDGVRYATMQIGGFDGIPQTKTLILKGDGGVVINSGACSCSEDNGGTDKWIPQLVADGVSTAVAYVPGVNDLDWSIEGDAEDQLGCEIEHIIGKDALNQDVVIGALITAGTESGVINVKAEDTDEGGCVYDGLLELTCGDGDGCSSGVCGALGSGSVENENGPDFRLGLGMDSADGSAGFLRLRGTAPSSDLATPDALRAPLRRNSDVIFDSDGVLAQVKVPLGLVVVTNVTSTSYELKFFYDKDVNSKSTTTGLYAYDDGDEFVTWKIENPSGDTDLLDISETRGTTTRKYQFEYHSDSTPKKWELVVDGEARAVWSWETSSGTTTNRFTEIKSGTTLQYYLKQTYDYIDSKRKLKQTVEGSGTDARTTDYTYYSASGNGNNNNLLKQIDYPDGSWEMFEYDSSTRVTKIYSAYGDQAPTTTASLCKVIEYTYHDAFTDDDDQVYASTPRKEVVKIKGDEVSRRYRKYTTNSTELILVEQTCTNPGLPWDNATNIKTTTIWHNTTNSVNERLKEVTHADGTMTFYSYSESSGELTTTVDNGDPNAGGTAIYNGTETVTVVGSTGETKSVTVKEIKNGTTQSTKLSEQTYEYTDELNTSYHVVHLNDRTNSVDFGCCGVDSRTDMDDVTVNYDYDDWKRLTSETTPFVTTTYTLDAVGRVLVTKRTPLPSGSDITLEQSAYDTAGHRTDHTNALGGVTTYAETVTSNKLKRTTTDDDGGTRIEDYYRDGRLQKITGTAAFPVRYEYGVESESSVKREYTKEIKLTAAGADTSEWTKTYYDGAGRAYKTVYAAASGTPSSQSTYNSKGQLEKQVDPDGVITLYAYNDEGERYRTVVDVDQDSVIDLSGKDRITETDRDVTTYSSTPVTRTRTYVYGSNGSSTKTLVSTLYVSTDGLKQWRLIPGQDDPTKTETDYGSNGARTVTTTQPDDSQTVQTYSYGRLISVVRKNSSGGQLQKTEYEYDNHGRRYQVIDARNGTAELTFNDADQVETSTTPSPEGGLSAQVTETFYDKLGRATGMIQPDGTTTTNQYYSTGLLKWTSGSRTYPVLYDYDDQGRMTSMKTYQSYSGNPSSPGTAAETTWAYDAYRGWLVKKVYAGETDSTDDYTYTVGGRLKTRVWERSSGLTTTYYYGFDDSAYSDDDHGDLVKITYSDSTPVVTQTYDRRGRLSTITRNSITTTRTYNDANLLLTESHSGGTLNNLSVERTYHSSSATHALKLKEVLAKRGTTTLVKGYYSYDTGGRLSQVKDDLATTYTVDYGYLANSPLIETLTFKQSSTERLGVTRDYDYLNRLRSISSDAGAESLPLSYSYRYNDANQRIGTTLNDGSHWIYLYDELGQVVSGRKYWRDGTAVAGQQYEYAFDDIGNRSSTGAGGDERGLNLRTADYSVNSKNQYTSRDVPAYIEVLGIAKVDATVTVEGSSSGVYRRGEYFRKELYDDNSSAAQYPTIDVDTDVTTAQSGEYFLPEDPESFTHDTDGNLTQDGRWAYTWDGENRLTKMERNDTSPSAARQKLEFEYDWQGRRIRKQFFTYSSGWVEQSDTVYLYDGWNVIAELDANDSNDEVRTYIWGTDLSGTMQGAGGVGGLLMVIDHEPSIKRHYVAYDGNGNVGGLVDSTAGTWSARYEYGPFGESIRANGAMADANPFRFSTKYEDTESGLLYYGYRYYNPSTGRWLNRDPINENGGEHLYAFVGNSAINEYDLFGLLYLPRVSTPSAAKAQCEARKKADEERGKADEVLPERKCVNQCSSRVSALKEKPRIKKLLDQYPDSCKKLSIICEHCRSGVAGAFYNPDNTTITICHNESDDWSDASLNVRFELLLTHELIHALQDCHSPEPYPEPLSTSGCRASLKREMEAYYCSSKGLDPKDTPPDELMAASVYSSCGGWCNPNQVESLFEELMSWHNKNKKRYCTFPRKPDYPGPKPQ